MQECSEHFDTLKQILRQARNPQALDDHPWTRSLVVQEMVSGASGSEPSGPGQRLVDAIAGLFIRLQPSTPPRRGKRLDSRWGEFGLLAALYFTPFNHGTPYPTSFTDAWGRIDDAILYFVFGMPAEALGEEDVKRYRLVGDELKYAPASTLSDWHRKGIQSLAEVILDRERFLSRNHRKASAILEPEKTLANEYGSTSSRMQRWPWLVVIVAVVLALALVLFKGWRIYQSSMLVYQDVTGLQQQARSPLNIESIQTVLPLLPNLQRDLRHLKQEADPVLWISPWLRQVPVYGNDLASAPALFDLVDHLMNASISSSQALQPLLDEADTLSSSHDIASLTSLLVQAGPRLQEADSELRLALTAREGLDAGSLSPRLQALLENDLDPLLGLAEDGLSLATALPDVLGAASAGPKTYLLLAQNEDELRPTGGFITSVGNLVLYNGKVISLEFEPVDTQQEDWTRPYPAAPWQVQDYMNSRVLILRDANWFSDYPTSAMWAEYLYAYTHDHSVDGVIAFDQQFLVMLLEQLGPLSVEGAPEALTAGNVVDYMREAKKPPSEDYYLTDWYRKEFISKIGDAMLRKLSTGGQDWYGLAQVLVRALNERHLLLQFDDPVMTGLAARHGWDGAIRPREGDYLIVTDTNVGFNKTNAVVDVNLTYDVDLTDIQAPESMLVISQTNNAKEGVPCIQWDSGEIKGEEWYPIDRCYWDYMRVYKQNGISLLSATPHAIPAEWMLLDQKVPARVDVLDEELVDAQGYGTLLVVPGGDSLSTGFQFALPAAVISRDPSSRQMVYRLRVQKQPGTLAHPLTLRVHLPARAILISSSMEAVEQDHNLLIKTDLRTDVELEVVFALP
jgi:hypothetical protein